MLTPLRISLVTVIILLSVRLILTLNAVVQPVIRPPAATTPLTCKDCFIPTDCSKCPVDCSKCSTKCPPNCTACSPTCDQCRLNCPLDCTRCKGRCPPNCTKCKAVCPPDCPRHVAGCDLPFQRCSAFVTMYSFQGGNALSTSILALDPNGNLDMTVHLIPTTTQGGIISLIDNEVFGIYHESLEVKIYSQSSGVTTTTKRLTQNKRNTIRLTYVNPTVTITVNGQAGVSLTVPQGVFRSRYLLASVLSIDGVPGAARAMFRGCLNLTVNGASINLATAATWIGDKVTRCDLQDTRKAGWTKAAVS